MTGGTAFSPTDGIFSHNPNLDTPVEEGSQGSEKLVEDDGNDLENSCNRLFRIEGAGLENAENDIIIIDGNQNDMDDPTMIDDPTMMGDPEIEGDRTTVVNDHEGDGHEQDKDATDIINHQNVISLGKDYPPPVVGMEFESYDDAYNYYNFYGKEHGFAIRVKSSWTKRNSKEKRGAVLCCNCEGFKTIKEANSRRKETRTGCLAMVRLRLLESNRWRVDEVKLEHNHAFDPARAQNSKSHKRIDTGIKRKVEPSIDIEVQTIKLYRTPIDNGGGCRSSSLNKVEPNIFFDFSGPLKLKAGESQVICDYFCRVQQTNPNFFYVMDLNDGGRLRNVFWIDSRSRAAYSYFGDVVSFDMTFLADSFEIPLFAFVGVNHHGDSILLGCGLLADQTVETYVWLFRVWLTCMLGRPPQTIMTDYCASIQTAIAEVFPRAHHRINLSSVIQNILQNLEDLQESEAFQIALNRTLCNCLKIEEFESAWEDMLQRFGLKNNQSLRSVYEDRERWAPVFLKDTFFAGISNIQNGSSVSSFFDGYVHRLTSLKEFFEIYEFVCHKRRQRESSDDLESRNSSPVLKTGSYYELQLSKLYTKEIFRRFQDEVVMIASCFSITQLNTTGSITTYQVKERDGDEILRDVRNYEVMFDKAGAEIRCICSCFNFKGFLCRHSLCVLDYNCFKEIPYHYILPRWRKDFRRLYEPDLGSNSVDITNRVQLFDHLYRRAMQVVGEGMNSGDHYAVAWQALKDSLNKVRLVADKHV